MTYKIPSLPSAKAYKEETADFWEVQAILTPGTYVSHIQISKIISKELDELTHEGVESEDDVLDAALDDVLAELARRPKYTTNKYPFELGKYSLKLKDDDDLLKNIYLFLLLCCRFNMQTSKVHDGIDGTLLFERLCAHVAKNYFGSNCESFVFGTAEAGSFETKVKDMILRIGEGGSFKNPNKNSPSKNDDSIDIVAWKEFSDERMGKLIAFGQCKTGTSSWKDGKHKLKPEDFCNKWFYQAPIHRPIPLVFICDTMNEDFNFYSDQQGYIIFNRFRILEYVTDSLDANIQADIQKWLTGALSTLPIKSMS